MHHRQTIILAMHIARRELRSGLRGFGVFLACLLLGVAAVAGVKSLSAAYATGLARDAASLLGGDVEVSQPLRPITPTEQAALAARGRVSHLTSLRVMVRRERPGVRPALASLRAVDAAYPLYGTVRLDPPQPLVQALALRQGVPGAIVAPQLLSRLEANIGDTIRVADAAFVIRAVLVKAPDAASGLSGLSALGPPILIAENALAQAGLTGPAILSRHAYRIKLPPGTDAPAVAEHLRQAFPAAGWRIRDATTSQPGVARFMERLSTLMSLVGLTALLLGGIGIAQAVSGYLDGRTASIAAMKSLGAPARLITWSYLIAILALGLAGILPGLAIGALVPSLVAPFLEAATPVHLARGPHVGALLLAGAFGLLTVLSFSLPPLARAARVSPLMLFRGQAAPTFHSEGDLWRTLLHIAPCPLALAGLIIATTPDRRLGIGFVLAVAVAVGVFWLFGRGAVRLARLAPQRRAGRLFLALRSLGRPDNRQVGQVLAALGLGLSTLCAMGQVDANFREALQRDIPRSAPDFFFLDIQPAQLAAFSDATRRIQGVTQLAVSPMARGRVTRLRGQKVEKLQVSQDVAWVLRGDRGLTFADAMPAGTRLAAGHWWPAKYAGPALVSVEEGAAKGLGLGLGDTVTVNVLGRTITARVASLRRVNWLGLSINFVFVFSPGALDGLPLTYLATSHSDKTGFPKAAEMFFRTISNRFPGITIIGVGEALADVDRLAEKIGAAVAIAVGTTLLAGVLVLIQTLAAGMRRKAYEAVIYKVCGASRWDIVTVLSLENGLLGLLAGFMALGLGAGLAWVFVTRFMELPFRLFTGRALGTVGIAAALTLGLGMTGLVRLLGRKVAPSLRNE